MILGWLWDDSGIIEGNLWGQSNPTVGPLGLMERVLQDISAIIATTQKKQGNRLSPRPETVDMFCAFHLWNSFQEHHLVASANPKWTKWYYVEAKLSFFWSPHWKKVWKCVLISTYHLTERLRNIFSQLCHKHSGSSCAMDFTMEALCLHWKHQLA